MCERPPESEDMKQFLHMIAPLGLQPFNKQKSRDVALVLSKALDYQNVSHLFKEDVNKPQVARESLHLLEMIMRMLEHWVQSLEGNIKEDALIYGYVVSLLEVLVHSPPFWVRLKQSGVLTSMVIHVQDNERQPDSRLLRKTKAIMSAIAAEKHSQIPEPVDLHRMRAKQVQPEGKHRHLPQQSKLVPVYNQETIIAAMDNQLQNLPPRNFEPVDLNLLNQSAIRRGSEIINASNAFNNNFDLSIIPQAHESSRIDGQKQPDNSFLRNISQMQRPVTEKEIPELCKLIAAGNKPDVAAFAMQVLVPVIQKTTMDWEIGEPQNLVNLISVVEHLDFLPQARHLQAIIVNEVMRQVTSE